ncbi:MAG: hypothetical protein ACYDH9_25850 [Limisphaerales bacterium]
MTEPSPKPGLGKKFAALTISVELAIWLLFLDAIVSVVLNFALGEVFPSVFRLDNFFIRFLVLFAAGLIGIVFGIYRFGGSRWLWDRAARRFSRWLTVGVGSLVVLYYSEERWRGKRAYAQLKREVEARGDKLGLAGVIPPPVPDDQNFALAPVFASNRLEAITLNRRQPAGNQVNERPTATWLEQQPLDLTAWQKYFRHGYTIFRLNPKTKRSQRVPAEPDFPIAPQPRQPAQDVLLALSKYDAELKELAVAAAQRPLARFPIPYERGFLAEEGLVPRAVLLGEVVRVLRLRAVAELAAAKGDAALRDVELLLRLADSVRNEPFFNSQFARRDMIVDALQPIWEGLANQHWSESQLETLQGRLAEMDLLADGAFALKANAAMHAELWTLVLSVLSGKAPPEAKPSNFGESVWYRLFQIFYPHGWAYLDQVGIYQVYEQKALPIIDLKQRRVFPERAVGLGGAIVTASVDPLYVIFVAPKIQQLFHDTIREFPFLQTAVDEAVLACALERYRLAHGELPEKLDVLAPQFIDKLPHDLITGQPLKYRRTDDGQFALYSVGWNGVDDAGKPSPPKTDWSGRTLTLPDLESGDWVWRYPPKH